MPAPPEWYELRELVKTGNFEEAKVLLARKPSVRSDINGIGETVLHYQAVENDQEGVAWLWSQGFDFNTRNTFGQSVASEVAQLGHRALLQWFISKGADVKCGDKEGRTALHGAASAGETEIVGLLLANEAEVNAKDDYGSAPLHNAAIRGFTDVVRLLLANKAEVNETDVHGWTPLQCAEEEGYNEVAALLREHGGHNEPLYAGNGCRLNAQSNGLLQAPITKNIRPCVGIEELQLATRLAWRHGTEVRCGIRLRLGRERAYRPFSTGIFTKHECSHLADILCRCASGGLD